MSMILNFGGNIQKYVDETLDAVVLRNRTEEADKAVAKKFDIPIIGVEEIKMGSKEGWILYESCKTI